VDGNYFEDLDGNGRQDLICLNQQGLLHGFFERLDSGKFADFSTFRSIPSEVQNATQTFKVDLIGDGHADWFT
jgi:hypothetical protein